MSVLKVLQEIREGTTLEEADRDLEALITAIRHTGKGGELSIKVKIAPFKEDTERLLVSVESIVKLPKPDPAADFFYRDGIRLTKRNPRQREMDLRDVNEPAKPPLDVDMETGEIRNAG